MFVITADQVASRTNPDLVPDALTAVSALEPGALALPPERTVGDEFQVLTANAATALKILLHLTRDGSWSVGLGVGTVGLPLPAHTREATGEAFIAARKAVTRAKCSPTRCAVESLHVPSQGHDVEALIDLLFNVTCATDRSRMGSARPPRSEPHTARRLRHLRDHPAVGEQSSNDGGAHNRSARTGCAHYAFERTRLHTQSTTVTFGG